jgi:hypothetical protein
VTSAAAGINHMLPTATSKHKIHTIQLTGTHMHSKMLAHQAVKQLRLVSSYSKACKQFNMASAVVVLHPAAPASSLAGPASPQDGGPVAACAVAAEPEAVAV